MTLEQGFVVTLSAFQGSLGQLVYALKQGNVAVEDVPLLKLVGQYLDYYQQYIREDIEIATETLPLVARVIEVKTRLLLPSNTQEDPEDASESLENTLEAIDLLDHLEQAILFLQQRRSERRLILAAQIPRPTYPRPERPLRINLKDLNQFASRLRVKSYFELAAPRLSLAEAMKNLRSFFARGNKKTLYEALPVKTWEYLSVHFSAMLELIKEGELRAEQQSFCGDIVLEAKGDKKRRAA